MAARRPKAIEVTIKPWWHSPLFVGIVCGLLGLTPWLYGQYQQKKIENDNAGFGLLTLVLSENKFRINDKNLVDIKFEYGVISKLNSWIAFNFEGKQVKLGRGFHQGSSSAIVRNVNCGFTYFYRPEAIYRGREVFGSVGWVRTPKCANPSDVANFRANQHFQKDF